jgi:hypothetical protein
VGKPSRPHTLTYRRDVAASPLGRAETVQVWNRGEPSGWPKSWGGITLRAPVVDASLGLSHTRVAVLSVRGGRVTQIEWEQEQSPQVCEGQASIVLEDCRIQYQPPPVDGPPPRCDPAVADRVAPLTRRRVAPTAPPKP